VLLVGLGRVTRLLRYLTDLPKTYTGEVVLGVATSTLDASGEVVGQWDMSAFGLDEVRAASRSFAGDILQVPPMVSAVKVDGKRLHQLARQGIEVERSARPVTVHRFDVDSTPEADVFAVEVECSSGTYIRTLAADLGAALGGGAHLRSLRRTAIGSFRSDDAHLLGELTLDSVMLPAEALRDYSNVTLDAAGAREVGYGRPLADLPSGTVAVLGPDGSLLAVYADGKPAVVLAPA
jgi:tRNA pseudouridine55 synthase